MVSTVSVVSPEVETERNEWRLRRDSYIKRPRAERTVGIIVTSLLVSLSIRLSLPSLSPPVPLPFCGVFHLSLCCCS